MLIKKMRQVVEGPCDLTNKGWGRFTFWLFKAALFNLIPNFCSFYGDEVHILLFTKLLPYAINKQR